MVRFRISRYNSSTRLWKGEQFKLSVHKKVSEQEVSQVSQLDDSEHYEEGHFLVSLILVREYSITGRTQCHCHSELEFGL